jgi:hypothetical protein
MDGSETRTIARLYRRISGLYIALGRRIHHTLMVTFILGTCRSSERRVDLALHAWKVNGRCAMNQLINAQTLGGGRERGAKPEVYLRYGHCPLLLGPRASASFPLVPLLPAEVTVS